MIKQELQYYMLQIVRPKVYSCYTLGFRGELAEWSIAPVLKTGDGKTSASSNLTLSAI